MQALLQDKKLSSQFIFMGRKSVPQEIRKDLWRPLLIAVFPTAGQGQAAWHKLREYRRQRELRWNFKRDDPKQALFAEDKRKQIMAYKPYAVADLADILLKQEAKGDALTKALTALAEEEDAALAPKLEATRRGLRKPLIRLAIWAKLGWLQLVQRGIRRKRIRLDAAVDESQESRLREDIKRLEGEQDAMVNALEAVKWSWRRHGWDVKLPIIEVEDAVEGELRERRISKKKMPQKGFLPTMDGVTIHWLNVQDADYAKSWPNSIIHYEVDRRRLFEEGRHKFPMLQEHLPLLDRLKSLSDTVGLRSDTSADFDKEQFMLDVVQGHHAEFKIQKKTAKDGTRTYPIRAAKDPEPPQQRRIMLDDKIYYLPNYNPSPRKPTGQKLLERLPTPVQWRTAAQLPSIA